MAAASSTRSHRGAEIRKGDTVVVLAGKDGGKRGDGRARRSAAGRVMAATSARGSG